MRFLVLTSKRCTLLHALEWVREDHHQHGDHCDHGMRDTVVQVTGPWEAKSKGERGAIQTT